MIFFMVQIEVKSKCKKLCPPWGYYERLEKFFQYIVLIGKKENVAYFLMNLVLKISNVKNRFWQWQYLFLSSWKKGKTKKSVRNNPLLPYNLKVAVIYIYIYINISSCIIYMMKFIQNAIKIGFLQGTKIMICNFSLKTYVLKLEYF